MDVLQLDRVMCFHKVRAPAGEGDQQAKNTTVDYRQTIVRGLDLTCPTGRYIDLWTC